MPKGIIEKIKIKTILDFVWGSDWDFSSFFDTTGVALIAELMSYSAGPQFYLVKPVDPQLN